MNAETGATYFLGVDVFGEGALGSPLAMPQEPAWGGRELSADESAAVTALRRGEPVVRVSEHVAQQVKLGQRELERRAKRRKASRTARKRNR